MELITKVRLFVHVHTLINVHYVFPQLVKCVVINYLGDHLFMLILHCGIKRINAYPESEIAIQLCLVIVSNRVCHWFKWVFPNYLSNTKPII